MSDEPKICPFMSTVIENDGQSQAIMVDCLKEKCMAWEWHMPVDEYDTYDGGYCRLIP
jgi:hypothetical protein